MHRLTLFALLMLVGCAESARLPDAEPTDAGLPLDASPADAAPPDAGPPDCGAGDPMPAALVGSFNVNSPECRTPSVDAFPLYFALSIDACGVTHSTNLYESTLGQLVRDGDRFVHVPATERDPEFEVVPAPDACSGSPGLLLSGTQMGTPWRTHALRRM
ncbi:MAG: hypothetical protein AB8I08_35210 [Sandaracinaceae bacterium]